MPDHDTRQLARDPSLDELVGSTLPGGCDDCNAYSTLARDDLGVYHLTVHHDDRCPWLTGTTR